jgi:hypothetical protein
MGVTILATASVSDGISIAVLVAVVDTVGNVDI